MNYQEAFEKSFLSLYKQGGMSLRYSMDDVGADDGCAYRGDREKKCALGFLIPDDKYILAFENNSLHPDTTNSYAKALSDKIVEACGFEATRDNTVFLNKLQVELHDAANFGWTVEKFQSWLVTQARLIAFEFNLTMPEGF